MKGLKQKQAPSQEQRIFRRFVISGIAFLSGMAAIVYANLVILPSTKQEAIAALGICVAAPTALIAAYNYLRLIFSRFKHFMDK